MQILSAAYRICIREQIIMFLQQNIFCGLGYSPLPWVTSSDKLTAGASKCIVWLYLSVVYLEKTEKLLACMPDLVNTYDITQAPVQQGT